MLTTIKFDYFTEGQLGYTCGIYCKIWRRIMNIVWIDRELCFTSIGLTHRILKYLFNIDYPDTCRTSTHFSSRASSSVTLAWMKHQRVIRISPYRLLVQIILGSFGCSAFCYYIVVTSYQRLTRLKANQSAFTKKVDVSVTPNIYTDRKTWSFSVGTLHLIARCLSESHFWQQHHRILRGNLSG